jgi:hypothetical protein
VANLSFERTRNNIGDFFPISGPRRSIQRWAIKIGGKHMQLYWVTTEDHDEDWFIVASSSKEAAKFHENMEGYNPGDAKAEEILDIPENISAEIGWPSDELLIELGAKFLLNDQSRVVEIAGRKFCEGMLEATLNEINDDLFEEFGEERMNKTKKSPPH